MPSHENRIIVACAGAGKTTRLVTEALAAENRRIAIVTYTNNNAREIEKRFAEQNSAVPRRVDVMTWFGFLLRECARPYQRGKYDEKRIESIQFVNGRSAKGIAEADTKRHYFAGGELIYSDKIARFVCECERISDGAITARLAQIYTDLYIDEFQDLAGWDFEIIKMFLRSGIRVTLVGDPRQHTFSTNQAGKNKQYLGSNVLELFRRWEHLGYCAIEHMNGTHRCNRAICELSNGLWAGMEPMTSLRTDTDDHEGAFLVAEDLVKAYMECFQPQVLRYDRRTTDYGYHAMNFGMAKGLQFERVLIVPTNKIREYLRTGALLHVQDSREKLHVAITRASRSIAFVFDGDSPIVAQRWTQP